jgi:molybdopterin-containing oxidoreductase family iron-sulfur binding subunit
VVSTDVVEVSAGGRRLEAPVWVLTGHAEGAATLHLGYGRRRVGRVGAGAGVDAYALRTAAALWAVPAAAVRPLGRVHPLACTQDHQSMEGRHPVRAGTLARYREEPEFARHLGHEPPRGLSMFPDYEYQGYAWGLAVDLSACTGCNACVVACQSENNVPVVGKEQVLRNREMHWLRIDRYYEGSVDAPATHHQPVMCQHCERAPCEVVCPVAATVHSDEGLNDMVYNRCVGTRYCSNNCPYKVRRFNFLEFVDSETEVLKMARNPDVTVRVRGVMEKCTYCVQRINVARGAAKRDGRTIRDGEVVTACQQACPSDAIRFGDVNDAASEVARWKALPLDYKLLGELSTVPRTSYLAKLGNPNPELETA